MSDKTIFKLLWDWALPALASWLSQASACQCSTMGCTVRCECQGRGFLCSSTHSDRPCRVASRARHFTAYCLLGRQLVRCCCCCCCCCCCSAAASLPLSWMVGSPYGLAHVTSSLKEFCKPVAYQTVSLMMSTVIVFASASWPHPINPLLLREGDRARVTTAKCGGHGFCVSPDYRVHGQRSDSAYCHGPEFGEPHYTRSITPLKPSRNIYRLPALVGFRGPLTVRF